VTGPAGGARVAHVIAEYSGHEAMGRTVRETAARVPGEHHLITTSAHDGTPEFASVCELGGAVGSFPLGRGGALAARLAELAPDVVHLHAGALGPLQVLLPALRRYRPVLTVYAWPRLPGPRALRRASWAELRVSNVLQARVVATTLLPTGMLAAALRRAGTPAVLTPDPSVRRRLAGRAGLVPRHLPSGAPTDPRRARFDAARPVVVFAGRAETVRGVDTLLDAFHLVRQRVPAARLRLLLIPRPELPAILARAGAARLGDALEVLTTPVPDLLGELAAAQVGCWPFKFDYTTSPPAMAVAEAMSVGLPVVGTDVACVRAVLRDRENGLAVPPADPAALAAALVRLLTDRAAWQRYATAGLDSVTARLGWDRMAAVTAAAYPAVPDPAAPGPAAGARPAR
jgi:alpha-maltose-1-phosphate synthase